MVKIQSLPAKVLFLAAIKTFTPVAFSLLLFSLLFFNQSFAQPVNAYFDPPEFENGDEVELIIEYGSVDDPVQNALSAHFEIAYDGFEIDESSKLSVDAAGASWFGWDEAYTSRITVNHTLHVITVDLERNESPVSGYGYVAKGSGITVDISEINAKKGPVILVKKAAYLFPAQPRLRFDAVSKNLNINWDITNAFKRLDIFDISGRIVFSSQSPLSEVSMKQFPSNIYFVKFQSELGVENLTLQVFH